ncbi:hypothetical protein Tco_0442039 [Tanacetum coccineum]
MGIKDKSLEVSKHANVALGSNSTYNVVNAGLESFPTVSRAHGIHSPASANERPNPAGNTPGMSTSYANVTGAPKILVNDLLMRHMVSFWASGWLIPFVANYVRNTWVKYGLVKSMLNSSTGIFSFQFGSIGGLNAVLENKDVVNVLVWVKLHCVFVTAFSEDGLSSIATNLGTLLMLDVTPPDGVWTEYVSEGVTSS